MSQAPGCWAFGKPFRCDAGLEALLARRGLLGSGGRSTTP